MLASRHSGPSGIRSRAAVSCEHKLACVIMQPFGSPVVPEVKEMVASVSSGTAQVSGTGLSEILLPGAPPLDKWSIP